jgi:hypothetical protein
VNFFPNRHSRLEAHFAFSVAGSDGVNEYLSYQVEDGRKVTIRMLSGKVVELP